MNARVSFSDLSDDDFEWVINQLRASYCPNQIADKLIRQYDVEISKIDEEVKKVQMQVNSIDQENKAFKTQVLNELLKFIKNLNQKQRSTATTLSYDNTCPICLDLQCSNRFKCCLNGICSSCAEMFNDGRKCPFCRAEIDGRSGLEAGDSRQQTEHNQIIATGSNDIQDALSDVLSPRDLTEINLLKSQIVREALEQSARKIRLEAIAKVRKKLKFPGIELNSESFREFVTQDFSKPKFWKNKTEHNPGSLFRKLINKVLEVEATKPIILQPVLEETTNKVLKLISLQRHLLTFWFRQHQRPVLKHKNLNYGRSCVMILKERSAMDLKLSRCMQ
ncbi:hypothetical protein P9112_013855 [Eukaryota sp. TZLM1-RC]